MLQGSYFLFDLFKKSNIWTEKYANRGTRLHGLAQSEDTRVTTAKKKERRKLPVPRTRLALPSVSCALSSSFLLNSVLSLSSLLLASLPRPLKNPGSRWWW